MRCAAARDWRKARPRISHQSPPARTSLVGREKRDCFAVYTMSGARLAVVGISGGGGVPRARKRKDPGNEEGDARPTTGNMWNFCLK